MAADVCKTSTESATLDHRISIGVQQPAPCQNGPCPINRSKQRLGLVTDVSPLDIRDQELLQQMMARHLMDLATFFQQPDPKPPPPNGHIFNVHCQRRTDASERVDHQPNQRRSRRAEIVASPIDSNSRRTSSGSITGVFPRVTEYRGPFTYLPGLTSTTRWSASQSNSIRTAARYCFVVASEYRPWRSATHAAT